METNNLIMKTMLLEKMIFYISSFSQNILSNLYFTELSKPQNDTKSFSWDNPAIIVSLISGVVSISGIILSIRLNNSKAKEIEILKNHLTQETSEKNARRQYEFEARKKLYQEYEPLLFQLIETSDDALYRIKSIARAAKNGNLNDDGWLSVFEYYAKSTIYKLFVPLAIYKIMQKKLTLVDLTVDSHLELRYRLAKQLYITYTDDFEFAKIINPIMYDPNNPEWQELREENSITYWRQGLPMGLLDIILDILIEKTNGEKERVIGYGEFEKKLITNESAKNDINLAKDIYLNFHPAERPVLWRILISQAQIFKALINLQNAKQEISINKVKKELFYDKNESIADFNWKNTDDLDSEIEEPFLVATEYLKKRFI